MSAIVVTRVPIKNVHGNTLDRLGEAVVAGRYLPGSSIPPEPMLCEELGVSRTVVREAIKSLVAKGLVVTGPKVGTRVLPEEHWNWFDPDVVVWHSKIGLSREFLRDLQELRRVVEPAAVRLAAERATAQDIAEIETAYIGMKAAIEQGGDYVTSDLRFHQGLLRACHNRMLVQMSKALSALLRTLAAARREGHPGADRRRARRHRAGAGVTPQAAFAEPAGAALEGARAHRYPLSGHPLNGHALNRGPSP